MTIPPKIHQIWIQGAAEMPRAYRAAVRTWKRRNRGWTHTLWDDRALHALLRERAPEWLPLYEAQAEMEARADVGRYALLDLFGGVYADVDTECRRPIAPLLAASASRLQVTLYTDPRHPPDPFSHATNSVIASSAGHPVWSHAREHIARNASHAWVVFRTGPNMLRPILRQHAERDPGDVRLIGYPYSITTFRLPKTYMRLISRFRRETCVLDFNDSARRFAAKEVHGWTGQLRRCYRQVRSFRISEPSRAGAGRD